jgi:hypothetical protein
MSDQDWTRIARSAIDEAFTGSMDAEEGAFLLRTTADLLQKLWDGGIIPDRLWTRIVVQGAISVLRSTANQIDPPSEE